MPSPSPPPSAIGTEMDISLRCATVLNWLRLEQEPILARTPYRRKKKGEAPVAVLGNLLADGTILAEVLVNLDALSHAAVLRAPKRPASSPDASRTVDARQIAHLYRHNTRRAVKVLGKVLEHLRRDPLPPGRILEYLGGDVARIPPSKSPKPSLKLVELVILAAMYGPSSDRYLWNIWHMPSSSAKAVLHSTMFTTADFFGLVPFDRILQLSNPDSSGTATNDPASEQMASSQIGSRKLSLVTDDGKPAPGNAGPDEAHLVNPKTPASRDDVVVAPMQIAHPDHHNLLEMSQNSMDDPEVLEQRYAYQEANARLQEVARARALVSRLEGSVLGTRGIFTEDKTSAPLDNTPPPDALSPTFTPLPEFTSFEVPLPASREPPVAVQRAQPPQVSLPGLDELAIEGGKIDAHVNNRDIGGSSGEDEASDEASLAVRRISDESDRSSVPSFSAMHPRANEEGKPAETPAQDETPEMENETPVEDEGVSIATLQETPALNTNGDSKSAGGVTDTELESTREAVLQEPPALDMNAATKTSGGVSSIAPFLSPIVKEDGTSTELNMSRKQSGLQDLCTESDLLFTSAVTAPPSAGLLSVDVPSPVVMTPNALSPTKNKVATPDVASPQLPPMFMAADKTREENISRAKAGGRKSFIIKPPPPSGALLDPIMNPAAGSTTRSFSPPPLKLSPSASGRSIVENAADKETSFSCEDEPLIGDTTDNGNAAESDLLADGSTSQLPQVGVEDRDPTDLESLGVAQRIAKLNLTPSTPVSAPVPSAHIPWTPPSPPSVSALVSTFAVKETDRNHVGKRTSVRGVSTMSPSPKLFEKLISVWQSSSNFEKDDVAEEEEEEVVVEYTAPGDDDESDETEEDEEEEEEIIVEYTAPSHRNGTVDREEEVFVEYTAKENKDEDITQDTSSVEPVAKEEVTQKTDSVDGEGDVGSTNPTPRSLPDIPEEASNVELPMSPVRGGRRRAVRMMKSPLQQASFQNLSGEPGPDAAFNLDSSVANTDEDAPSDADMHSKRTVDPPSSEITTSTTDAERRNASSCTTVITDTQNQRLSYESQQGTSSAHPSVELGTSSGSNHGIRVECGSVRVETNRLDWLTQELLAARDAINQKNLELHIAEKDRTDEKEVLILQKQDAESVVSAMKHILAEREGELREARRRLSVAITGGQAKRRSSGRNYTSEEMKAKVEVEASKKAEAMYNERAKELEANAATESNGVSGEQYSQLVNRFEQSDALTKDVAEKSHTEMNRLWGEVQTSMEEKMMQMVDRRDRELADLKIQLAQRQQAVDELQEQRLRLVNHNAEVQAEATSAKQERELIITQAAMEISQVQAQLVLVDKFSKKLHETFKETEILRAQVADSQAKMAAFASGNNTNGLSAREAKELREALANAQVEVDNWKDQAEQAKWEKNEAENRALEMDRLYNMHNTQNSGGTPGGTRNQKNKKFVGGGEDGGYSSDRTEENGGSTVHHHSMSSGMSGEREPTFDSVVEHEVEVVPPPPPKPKVRMWHTIKNMVTGSHKASNRKPPKKPARQAPPRQARQRQREVQQPIVAAPYSSPKLSPRDFVQSYRGDAELEPEPELAPPAPEPPTIPTPPISEDRSMAASSMESDRRLHAPRRLKDRRDRDSDALSF